MGYYSNSRYYSFRGNVDSIISRFNNALMDLANAKTAQVKGDTEALRKKLCDGGEALSQTIEWAVKYHLINNEVNNEAKRYANDKTFNIYNAIQKYYCTDRGERKDLWSQTLDEDTSPKTNFRKLYECKNEITNKSKHNAQDLEFSDLENYEPLVRTFLSDYITKKQFPEWESFCEPQMSHVSQLYYYCDKLQTDDRQYVLLVDGKIDVPANVLMRFDWSLVIDLDASSLENGFAKSAKASTSKMIRPQNVRQGQLTLSSLEKTEVWYFANGIKSYGEYCSDYTDFLKKKYKSDLENFCFEFCTEYKASKTIIFSLVNNHKYLNAIFEAFQASDTVSKCVVVSSKENTDLENSANSNNCDYISMSSEEVVKMFDLFVPIKEGIDAVVPDTYKLPHLNTDESVTGNVSSDRMRGYEAYVDVLYLGIDNENSYDEFDFLIGKQSLSWYGARYHWAAEFPSTKFRRDFDKPITDCINKGVREVAIVHEPGYGGSTMARILAYYYHEDYPVLFVKKYDDCLHSIIENIHQYTRKTVLVFIEIPIVMDISEGRELLRNINKTRQVLFCFVCRTSVSIPKSLKVIKLTDWGNDIQILVNRYIPYLDRYDESTKNKKLNELNRLIHCKESYKKTPFYVGLITFEEDFVAIDDYLRKFSLMFGENVKQRQALEMLCLTDLYYQKGLPASFFQNVFDVAVDKGGVFKLENMFSPSDGIVEALLLPSQNGHQKLWKLRHTFFAKSLLKILFNNIDESSKTYKVQLFDLCKTFIIYCSKAGNDKYYEELLKEMFIGSGEERYGDDFVSLVKKMDNDAKLGIFNILYEYFPSNAHFCSHLARCYTKVEKNALKALEYSDKAIQISDCEDPVLFHMRGMCKRSIILDKLNEIKQTEGDYQNALEDIINKDIPSAEFDFEKSRHINSQHGYVAHIQMLVRAIDVISLITKTSKDKIVSSDQEPYADWLDTLNYLLLSLKRLSSVEEYDDSFVTDCETQILELYSDYSKIIETLNNKLQVSKDPQRTRRQLASAYINRDESYKTDIRINKKILQLLEDNLSIEPDNERNLFLWFKVVRYSRMPKHEVLVRLDTWRNTNSSLESNYYSYVLNAIKAIEGSTENCVTTINLISECKKMSRGQVSVREWYMDSENCLSLLSQTDYRTGKYMAQRKIVYGRISEVIHSGAGKITIENTTLDVFFIPSVAKIDPSMKNKRVSFCLGFSYDGMRADSETIEVIE